MEVLTDDWFGDGDSTVTSRRSKRPRRSAVVVPLHLCQKSGVLDALDKQRSFVTCGCAGVTQSSVRDCVALDAMSEEQRRETIKHWRARLGGVICTAGYFGWEHLANAADDRMRERCQGTTWNRELRQMCISLNFDRNALIDWFAEKLNYPRLHWLMVSAWIEGHVLYEWWNTWVPSSHMPLMFERFATHFRFNITDYCVVTPLQTIARGYMCNMLFKCALLRSFIKHDVDLLGRLSGRPQTLTNSSKNALLKLCTLLQDEDFEALCSNLESHRERRGQARLSSKDTLDFEQKIAVLSTVCCPRVIERWARLYEVLGIQCNDLASSWFDLRLFY